MPTTIQGNSILVTGGVAPPNPAAGDAILYAKADEKFYTKDSGGTERAVEGQVQPTCFVDGTPVLPVFLAFNAGWASVVRTPAGDPAGDYTVTLAAPVTGTVVAPPGITSGRVPLLVAINGSGVFVGRAEAVGFGFPYSDIRVKLRDKLDAPVDGFFTLALHAV